MFSGGDRRGDGENPVEDRRAAERRSLRDVEDRLRFQHELREVGKPYDLRPDQVALRPESATAIRDDSSSFRIQHGRRDVGWVYMEHDQQARRSKLVDLKIADEESRGVGVGTEALRQAEAHARQRGMREIHGELSKVDTDEARGGPDRARERLANFYRKNGYRVDLTNDETHPIFAHVRKDL